MNTNYQYKGVELSKILHPTTDTATYTNPPFPPATIDLPISSSYYNNMSNEDRHINPLVAAFRFGYDLPTLSFPVIKDISDNNIIYSYREAHYKDYTSSSIPAPTWATHLVQY